MKLPSQPRHPAQFAGEQPMTHTNPTFSVTDELSGSESYPTFWDAIPVDSGTNGNTPSPTTVSYPQEDAYAAFLDQTEDGPVATLSVEQTDVG